MHDAAAGRVLVIGGAGAFGSRLVAGLLATTGVHVVAAGRSAARLAELQRRLADPGGRLSTRVLDARGLSAEALRATGCFAVVDAAGPFQDGDHRTAAAAIAAGLHYIDLADGRAFVAGFGALDAAARAAGTVALTGASSTPALSHAVLDRLVHGWLRVDQVAVAILPGNRAPRGLSVMQAILGYAGRPVRVFLGGRWQERPGWGMLARVAVPGLGRRWCSLVETPDLDLLPARFAVRDAAVFRAGLELPLLHLGLWAASLPVRLGALRSLRPLARAFRAMAGLLERFGTDRGGMVVEAWGRGRDGDPVQARWVLLAEAGDGPVIPTLPALAALRALAAGEVAPGARACVGVLDLAQIEAEFAPYRITHRSGVVPGLYESVLGERFAGMPAAVRRMHRTGAGLLARGEAQVDGAEGWAGQLAARLARLPSRPGTVPVEVAITPDGAGERWTRRFGGHRFSSTLHPAGPSRLLERFGPLTFELDLLAGPSGVTGMPVRRWWFGPLPLPRALAPTSVASEGIDEAGRFVFDVEVSLPWRLGRVVRYRGWLVPAG